MANIQTTRGNRILLILTALQKEYKVASAVVQQWQRNTPSAFTESGAYDNIVVEQIGMRARLLKEVLIHHYHNEIIGLVIMGLAGACSPNLAVGDLVIDSRSHEASRVETIINAMSNGPRCFIGPIHTSKHIVGDTAEKHALFIKDKFIAVDMENQPTLDFAQRRNVPWIGLRTISDTAMDSLPKQISSFTDPLGKVRPLAMTIALASNPFIIKDLIRLKKTSGIASHRLAEALKVVIRSGWPFQS